MTETAEAIITDALLELTVQEGGEAAESFEYQRGVRYLNRMMDEFAARDINLGYTEVTQPNDVLTVPSGSISGIVANLAVRLANALDIPVSPSLAQRASYGLDTMRQIGFSIGKMNFSGNLPIGSGNEGSYNTYSGQSFYDDCCEDTNEC